MRAIVIKNVLELDGSTVFGVGQLVYGKLMQPMAPDEQWAEVGTFITKIGDKEYAIEHGYFKRPLVIRIGDLFRG